MRTAAMIVLVGLCALMCTVLCTAQNEDAVLEVKGRGVEGRPRYEGGGKPSEFTRRLNSVLASAL